MLKIKIHLIIFDKLKEGGTPKGLAICSLNLKVIVGFGFFVCLFDFGSGG